MKGSLCSTGHGFRLDSRRWTSTAEILVTMLKKSLQVGIISAPRLRDRCLLKTGLDPTQKRGGPDYNLAYIYPGSRQTSSAADAPLSVSQPRER